MNMLEVLAKTLVETVVPNNLSILLKGLETPCLQNMLEATQNPVKNAFKLGEVNAPECMDRNSFEATESVAKDEICKVIENLAISEKGAMDDGIFKINWRNQDISVHPETGVPFEYKEVLSPSTATLEYKNFPQFESKGDFQLPENLYKASDPEQFDYCNQELSQRCEKDPKWAENTFDKDQLDYIRNVGEKPREFTWHHQEAPGSMQLVDRNIHAKTGHTGGRSIWGGGSDLR